MTIISERAQRLKGFSIRRAKWIAIPTPQPKAAGMPRRPKLPPSLEYLEPFRKVLNRLEPEEFNEGMDQSVLHELVLKRTEGLSDAAAGKILERDYDALKTWLADSGCDDTPLLWLEAQLSVLPDLIGELRQHPAEKALKLQVEMELPEGARSRRMQHGVLKITWKRITFMAVPIECQHLEMSLNLSSSPGDKITPVSFGAAKGHKRLRVWPTAATSFDYFLELPNGAMQIALFTKADHLDASAFEQFFPTLRLVPRT